jgi:hypothetical protein
MVSGGEPEVSGRSARKRATQDGRIGNSGAEIGEGGSAGVPRPLVGTARRAVRGGFGETALPATTRLWYEKRPSYM